MKDYSSMIDHPHFRSKKYPPMSMTKRAAQFAPFAALVGYDEAVLETGRLTSDMVILDEDAINEIDDTLRQASGSGTPVNITYFVKDENKAGGSYKDISGRIRKVDTLSNKVIFDDGSYVPLEDITDISII